MYVDPPLVDSHAHVFTRRMPLSETAWSRPDYDFPAEEFVRTLDKHNVPFGVIAAASIYDDYSDYTVASLRAHPRLRATINVRPDVDRLTLDRMDVEGVVGIRLQWLFAREIPDLRSVEYRRLFTRVADLGWHVHLLLDSPRIPYVLPALEEAGVNVVIDHFGYPDPNRGVNCDGFRAVLRSFDTGNTWVKISSGFRFKDPQKLRTYASHLLSAGGPERLLWGSDAPFVGHEKEVTYADALATFYDIVPDSATRRAISDSALRLYFF